MIKDELKMITTDSEYYQGLLNLRDEVLRKPIGLTLSEEDTSKDHEQIMFAFILGKKVMGCLMAVPLNDSKIKFRQMAVTPSCQGQQVGSRLLHFAETYCKQQGFLRIELHSRKSAFVFYLKNGYTLVGDEFMEVGIPHKKMQKFL